MEDGSTKGLKQERERRKRVTRIKMLILWISGIWLIGSMVICGILICKVYFLEEKMEYLLENFTIHAQDQEKADLQGMIEEEAYNTVTADVMDEKWEESYVIAQAINQQENLAQPGDIHKVYLTFDDGPSSNTIEILDILKEHDVKATFFVIGNEEEEARAIYQRIVEEGHTLAMHSYSHKYSQIYGSVDAFKEDYDRIQNYLFEVTGQECLFYRFPGGSSNHVSNTNMSEFIKFLNKRGITYFDWNVSSGDAASSDYTVEELVENVVSDVKKYKTSIVLMHDAAAKSTTVEALEAMIEKLEKMGVEILPIDESTTVVQHIAATSVEQQ